MADLFLPLQAAMKQKIDIETWARKDHFKFFSQFEEPFYGVCVNVDCTAAYRFSKANNLSFYLYTVYKCLAAAQQIEAFRMRIEDGEVVIYDQINSSSTVARANGTFGYGYYPYNPSLSAFMDTAIAEVNEVKQRADLVLSPVQNVIRFSSLPWVNFTSISHATSFSVPNSCPSISFGKMTEADGKRSMPMSIHVNHALVDGLHIGQYIDLLQQLLNQ